MSLEEKLAAQRAASAAKFSDEVKQNFGKAAAWLKASGIARNALGVGAIAPQFELPDTEGSVQSLSGLLSAGPLVVTFYRGVW